MHELLNNNIEAIWFFQCRIEFCITEWSPKAVFSWVAVATSANTSFGAHEGNKIRTYTEKIKQPLCYHEKKGDKKLFLFLLFFHLQ